MGRRKHQQSKQQHSTPTPSSRKHMVRPWKCTPSLYCFLARLPTARTDLTLKHRVDMTHSAEPGPKFDITSRVLDLVRPRNKDTNKKPQYIAY